MPRYTKHGKQRDPLPQEQFDQIMSKVPTRTFKQKRKATIIILLYYTGLRIQEILRATKEQFRILNGTLLFDVGPREKSFVVTPPLEIPIDIKWMSIVVHAVEFTRKEGRVCPFSSMTAWRLVDHYFHTYPHYFRLNRITDFLTKGFTIPEVMSWSGHKNIESINSYLGQASVTKLGKSLGRTA